MKTAISQHSSKTEAGKRGVVNKRSQLYIVSVASPLDIKSVIKLRATACRFLTVSVAIDIEPVSALDCASLRALRTCHRSHNMNPLIASSKRSQGLRSVCVAGAKHNATLNDQSNAP